MMKAGFLVNPVAGCGVGLNLLGSDSLDASSCADSESVRSATKFLKSIHNFDVTFLTSSSLMGEECFKESGKDNYRVIYQYEGSSDQEDTVAFLEELKNEKPDILVFFGGDGTAELISEFPWEGIVIAVPTGTKMFSSVFAINLQRAVEIFNTWMKHSYTSTRWGEVVDIGDDREKNRLFRTELRGYLKIPDSENIVRFSKAENVEQNLDDLIGCFVEKMDQGTYIVGPGSTCKEILKKLRLPGTLYGFDIIKDSTMVRKDATREDLINAEAGSRMLLSPLGSQGFLIGRGNRQINCDVIKRIGFSNIIVLGSQRKMQNLNSLYVDIQGSTCEIPPYIKVITGCGTFKVVKVRN